MNGSTVQARRHHPTAACRRQGACSRWHAPLASKCLLVTHLQRPPARHRSIFFDLLNDFSNQPIHIGGSMFPSYSGRDVQLKPERIASMTATGAWHNRRFIEFFDEQVRRQAHKPYVISHRADTGEERAFSYAEFDDVVGRIACGLFRLGIRRGDIVSYQIPNRWEFIAISLACARIGAVTNPLMPILRERELTFMLGLAESTVLIVPKTFRGFDHLTMALAVQRATPGLKTVLALDDRGPQSFEAAFLATAPPPRDELERIAAQNQPDPNDLLQLMYTSGTTGEPKGVMHSSNTLLANVIPFAERLRIGGTDVMVCPTPLAHQLGYLFGLLMPAVVGGSVVLQDVWNPSVCAQLIQRYRGTFCLGATPFLADLADLPGLPEFDISSLRMFVSGGAPIPPPLVVRAKERLRADIVSIWGMTEVSAATTVHLGDRDEKIFGTDGVAMPHAEVIVVDQDGRELPRGQSGILKTRGPNVFLGYLKRPNLYGHDAAGWFDTGDLARMDEDGYIRITGRSKDMIIRGGENIPVVEIENMLYRHPSIQAVAIVGMPDARLGERACAYVVLKPGRSLSLADVTTFLDTHKVAKSYFPERVEIIPEMPMTATGKIQKFVLRERARAL